METPIKMDDLGVPPFTETTNKFLQDFLILKANRNPPHPTASEQQVKIKSHVGLSEKGRGGKRWNGWILHIHHAMGTHNLHF